MTYNVLTNYFLYSNKFEHLTNVLDNIEFDNLFLFVVSYEDIIQIKTWEQQISSFKVIQKQFDNSNIKIIYTIVGEYEGPTYQFNLKDYIEKVIIECNLSYDDFLIFSSARNHFGDPIRFSVIEMFCGYRDLLTFANILQPPKSHFVSLARIAKKFRIDATVSILEKGLDKFGNCSLGSGFYVTNEENYLLNKFVPEKYKNLMPLTIDGVIANENDNLQKRATDEKINGAFINFSMETCFDYEYYPQIWNAPMITEKSMKAFAWGQVPLFLTMPNSIKYLREYGFDLFDDIIDHSYDNEHDPYNRIKLVIAQLENICKFSINVWQQYKQNNSERFESNRIIYENLADKLLENTINNLQNTLDKYKI